MKASTLPETMAFLGSKLLKYPGKELAEILDFKVLSKIIIALEVGIISGTGLLISLLPRSCHCNKVKRSGEHQGQSAHWLGFSEDCDSTHFG
jgi:hypothetical protein